MNFDKLQEFSRELKQLTKKYQSLPEDLEEFKRVATVIPLGHSKHFNIITKNDKCTIIKARLFCRYLKGSSLRIIYAYYKEISKIEFIEIYSKADKENEDKERIKEYLKDLK